MMGPLIVMPVANSKIIASAVPPSLAVSHFEASLIIKRALSDNLLKELMKAGKVIKATFIANLFYIKFIVE